jgi:hypothetical protein
MRPFNRAGLVGATVLALVLAGGIAYAAIPAANGTITACYKANGSLRLIDAEAGQACSSTEQALLWNQTGPQGAQGIQGPEGPQGVPGPPGETVRGYRVLRATPDEVEITVVGTGPLGFPESGLGSGTHILAMQLPQGVYVADATIAARKESGNGDFACWVHNSVRFSIFTRTTLGNAPGHVIRNTVSSSGIFSIPAGGGTLLLECWQAALPEAPGSPSGVNPTVFYATLQATSVSHATIVRYPAGTTTELP